MREPVSKHHVYHEALMYDIGVGGIMLDCFFMSDIDLLIIHKIISKLSFVFRKSWYKKHDMKWQCDIYYSDQF